MVEATKKLNIPSAVAVLIIIDAPRLARTKKAAKKAFLLFEIFFVNQNVTNAQSNPKITLGNLKANSEKPKVFKLMTCSQCAALLIQAGINKVVVPDYVEPQRWQESFDLARAMFIEAGVSVHRISMSGDLNEEIVGLPEANS